MSGIYCANPSSQQQYNVLLGYNEKRMARLREPSKTKLFYSLKHMKFDCPVCGSMDVEHYFVDKNLNPIPRNCDPETFQGKCRTCGYDDELHKFAPYRLPKPWRL